MKNRNSENKPRKTVDGSIRSKDRTKQKLIDAVGKVLKEKGYIGLTINNIVKKAGVDRRLVSLYFGGIDNLIEEYLNSHDYWMQKVAPQLMNIAIQAESFGEKVAVDILHTVYDAVQTSPDLQKMLLWQISEYHDKLKLLAENRDKLGSPLFQATERNFEGTQIDIRAVMAVQIAGIYFLNLHAKSNKATFCEIDLNTKIGENRIKDALKMLMHLVYEKANNV